MRTSLLAVLFAAGLLAGIIGSSLAADIGSDAISAAGDGAWILGRNGEVRHCWSKANQFGGREVECSKPVAP